MSTNYLGKRYSISYTYLDCLRKEVSYDNPFLHEFFKALNTEYNLAFNEYSKSLFEESKKYLIESEELRTKYLGLIEKLEGTIAISELPMPNDIYAKEDSSKYISFNGVNLLIPYFIDNDKEATKAAIILVKNLQSQKQDLLSVIKKFQEKIEFNRRKLGKFGFKKKTINEEISRLEKEQEKQIINYEEVCKKIDTYTLIEKMSVEEKETFLELLKIYQQSFDLKNKSQKIFMEAQRITSQRIYIPDLQKKVFRACISSGKITAKILRKVFLQMDKAEIKGRRGEYNFSIYNGEKESFAKEILPLLEWFIREVYESDETFVDRNKNLLDGVEKVKAI